MDSPERLPRRAVRGLGAHSPHQPGWRVWHGLADGAGSAWQCKSKVFIESSKVLPSPILVLKVAPRTTASLRSLIRKLVSDSRASGGFPWRVCQT
jgi:hypothetical protein